MWHSLEGATVHSLEGFQVRFMAGRCLPHDLGNSCDDMAETALLFEYWHLLVANVAMVVNKDRASFEWIPFCRAKTSVETPDCHVYTR